MAEQPQNNAAPAGGARPPAPGGGGKPPGAGDKKPTEEKKEGQSAEAFITEAFGVAILAAIIAKFLGYFTTGKLSLQIILDDINNSPYGYIFRDVIVTYVTIANILCLFFVIVLAFSLIKVRQLQRKWHAMVNPDPETEDKEVAKNERWERVVEHASSDNPSDWRLAVLEADIILDELLDTNGYVGDTIGDKLKKAKTGEFKTLQLAWEAHRIRNAIAHEGQDFVLTQREARRILGLYEQVFKEFDFI